MQYPVAIITPTRRRLSLLRALSQCIENQCDRGFVWFVVHDGPLSEREFAELQHHCPNARLAASPQWARDSGASPRLLGCKLAQDAGARYAVFWDDDNFFHPTALKTIRQQLARCRFPKAMLVPVEFGSSVCPPVGIEAKDLTLRQVDTANLVLELPTAVHAFQHVVTHKVDRGTDFAAFDFVRNHHAVCIPPDCSPVGIYDGTRALKKFMARVGIRHNLMYWFQPHRIYYAARSTWRKFSTLFSIVY
jgi:glycosyltransferase involved in cell wall biosynthesis